MSVAELHGVLLLRCQVFVLEQACAYADIDGRDPAALHLLARANDRRADDRLAGCARVFSLREQAPAWTVGRVAVAEAHRGSGLGRRLMLEVLAEIGRRDGSAAIELSAQAHLERFYASLGFSRVSPDYPEDGIPHCRMRRAHTGG